MANGARSLQVLWYDEPAANWFGALPLGNGRMAQWYTGASPKRP